MYVYHSLSRFNMLVHPYAGISQKQESRHITWLFWLDPLLSFTLHHKLIARANRREINTPRKPWQYIKCAGLACLAMNLISGLFLFPFLNSFRVYWRWWWWLLYYCYSRWLLCNKCLTLECCRATWSWIFKLFFAATRSNGSPYSVWI